MIKKNAREDRTDNDASTIHQELMAHAIKLLGSEERARAMLGAGKLHLLVSKQRRALNSRWKPCGAFARSTGKPLPSPRQWPWRPLQAAWGREYWSQDRTRKAAVAGSHEASLVPQARRGNLTGQVGARSRRARARSLGLRGPGANLNDSISRSALWQERSDDR
jgi:hypothetical protein